VKWLALCAALLWSCTAHALDTNDRLELSLDGGEVVVGWFVRAEADAVVLSVRGLKRPTRVPLDIVAGIKQNGKSQPIGDFRVELKAAHDAWLAWLVNPPPHPPAVLAAAPSLVIPGAGQAMLGQWREAGGYLLGDLVVLGAGALELHGEQRLGVLLPLTGVALLLRVTSISDAARTAARRGQRLREGRVIQQGPTQR
jgi:hypothetical protein